MRKTIRASSRFLLSAVALAAASCDRAPDEAATFLDLCGMKAEAAPEGRFAVLGRDGWMFLKSELRHVSVGRFWGTARPR